MDADLNLNTSGDLPDHTAASRKATPAHHLDVSAEDLARGYSNVSVEKIGPFDPDASGGENQVGDPWNRGGFLGRPQGFAR